MWRNTIYDMPAWVSSGLADGSVDHVEYSDDHSEDIVVLADGRRFPVDMRRDTRVGREDPRGIITIRVDRTNFKGVITGWTG